jgi:hypothetical protein
MFDLRFISVAADDTYALAAAKATRNLRDVRVCLSGKKQTLKRNHKELNSVCLRNLSNGVV